MFWRCLQSLALLAIAAAVASGGGDEAIHDDGPVPGAGGRVAVFVLGSRDAAAAPVTILPLEVRALLDGGGEIPLALETGETSSGDLADRQAPLASGAVPAGLYRGLRVELAHLSAPDQGEEGPPRIELRLAADFRVFAGETATLVLEWNLRHALRDDGTLSDAAWSMRPGEQTVRTLTLYVTDEARDRVIAVNRDNGRVFANIPVGRRPRGIDVGPGGRRAYVANSGDDTISVIDTANQRVVDTLSLKGGAAPEDVVTALDGRRLVVSCPGLSLVAVLDPLTNAYLGDVDLSRPPGRLAAGRALRTAFALVPEGNQVVAIDVVRVRLTGAVASLEAGPTDLVVDPGRERVFVTHQEAPVVTVLDGSLRPQEELQIDHGAYGAALDRDGRRLYLSGGDVGGVSLVGTDLGTIVRRWDTPEAYLLALDPDGKYIFATGGGGKSLLVLDRIAGRLSSTIPLAGRPFDLAVVP